MIEKPTVDVVGDRQHEPGYLWVSKIDPRFQENRVAAYQVASEIVVRIRMLQDLNEARQGAQIAPNGSAASSAVPPLLRG